MVRKYTSEETKEILLTAIEKYGETMQQMVAIEELSELQKAITKYFRKQSEENRKNIIEELADVYIVLQELQYIHDIDILSINKVVDEKIDRLRKRIGENK